MVIPAFFLIDRGSRLITNSTLNSKPGLEPERKPIVLVVEDEVLIRILLADSLREAGYSVLEAASGDEALILLGLGVRCDLVISDVRMPGQTDGQALLRRIKLTQCDLPVILVSGHLLSVDAVNADGFFSKPYDLWDVVAAVGRLIKERQ